MEKWKVLLGTYENGAALKIVPVDHNDPRFIMLHLGTRRKPSDAFSMPATARAFAERIAAAISK